MKDLVLWNKLREICVVYANSNVLWSEDCMKEYRHLCFVLRHASFERDGNEDILSATHAIEASSSRWLCPVCDTCNPTNVETVKYSCSMCAWILPTEVLFRASLVDRSEELALELLNANMRLVLKQFKLIIHEDQCC